MNSKTKIGIIICDRYRRCAGGKCFRAIKNKEGAFSVEESITKIRLSIHGEVVSGSITIVLVLPNGTEFKKLTMDETADIMWSESITIKEDDKKYYGDWKYRISTNKADGEYNFSINTY